MKHYWRKGVVLIEWSTLSKFGDLCLEKNIFPTQKQLLIERVARQVKGLAIFRLSLLCVVVIQYRTLFHLSLQ